MLFSVALSGSCDGDKQHRYAGNAHCAVGCDRRQQRTDLVVALQVLRVNGAARSRTAESAAGPAGAGAASAPATTASATTSKCHLSMQRVLATPLTKSTPGTACGIRVYIVDAFSLCSEKRKTKYDKKYCFFPYFAFSDQMR